MVTGNILHRVFFIKTPNMLGTGFTIEHNDIQYLITARHLFVKDSNKTAFPVLINHASQVTLEIYRNNMWNNLTSTVYFHTDVNIDIAVVQFPADISPRTTIGVTSDGVSVSQNVFFLGFPFSMVGLGMEVNNQYPVPFVKSAILSALMKDANGRGMLYLDGYNNIGFSGGPVVFEHPQGSNNLRIAAVTRGYVSQENKVNSVAGVFNYLENSGIIVSYNIQYAFDIIASI